MNAPDAARPAESGQHDVEVLADFIAAHRRQTNHGCSWGCLAAALAEAGIGSLAQARAEGVNEGIRLAAQLVRDHVLGETGERVANFLDDRADRPARAAAQQATTDGGAS